MKRTTATLRAPTVEHQEAQGYSDLDTLSHRLTCLERQNRHLKRAALAVVAGLGLLSAMGAGGIAASESKIVRAERFELIQNGKCLAVLEANKQGSSLRLLNSDGIAGVNLGLNAHGGEMRLTNKANRTTAGVFSWNDGGNVILYKKDGTRSVGIGALESGGNICVYRGDGEPAGGLVGSSKGGVLGLYDGNGRPAFGWPP